MPKPSLEYLKSRCTVDWQKGCWLWMGVRLGTGYGTFTTTMSGKKMTYRVHRLAWEAKHGLIHSGLLVLHKNECHTRHCCNPDHLYLGDQTQNMKDMKELGSRKGKNSGIENMNAVLRPEDVEEIRTLARFGRTQRGIAREFAVSRGCVRGILKGRTWSANV